MQRRDYDRAVHGEGRPEGRLESRIENIVTVLEARGFSLSSEARARITGCTDPDQLETWFRRAATITTVDELFA